MSEIRSLCDELLDHLAHFGYPIRLKPGLSFREIEEVQRDLPIILPKAAAELYNWRNGTPIIPNDTTPGACMFPWWCFDTIDEAVARYKGLKHLSESVECIVELWDPSWFPIFSASDGSSIGIRCELFQADDGLMMCYEHSEGTQIEYVSLHAMLQTICTGYEERAIFLGSGGELDYNVAVYSEIHKRFNPGIQRVIE